VLVFRLALRALAWRAAASATVFVVALIGIVAAAVGPIYLHAVNETVLAERLTQAPQSQRDVRIDRATLVGATGVDWHGPVTSFANRMADKRWFDPPVYSEEAQVYYKHLVRYAGTLAAIDDLCKHVRVVDGRCVADPSTKQTVITARTARSQQLAVGDVIAALPIANVKPVRLRVVGVVEPIAAHGAFWQPWDLFNAEGAHFDTQLPRLDAFFVSHAALASRTSSVAQTISANVHLRPSAVHLDDLPAIRAKVKSVEELAAGAAGKQGLSDTLVGSRLGEVLDGMRTEMSLARTLIILPTAQLVLLAIFVLYAVVAGTTAVQGPEVALAKLRGRRPRSVLFQGVVQPILLILLAAPVAAALAWLVVRVVVDDLLGRHVQIVFPASALAVVGLAAVGGIVAAVVAARRIVVSPVGALLRRGTDTSGSSVGVALADAAAVALALAGLVELIAGGVLNSGKTDPLSALAPTLLAIAAAIVVLRLLPFVGRLFVRWTRDTRRLASFLAVRQIVRRPAGARVLLLIGVGLALATFAVTNWSVARSNRQLRALNQAGAATVLDVVPGRHVYDLRKAVDRADPAGHSMAVARVQAAQSTPLLAVDTKRFAGVAAWHSNYADTPLQAVLAELSAGQPPSIAFRATFLRLDVDLTKSPKGRIGLTAYVTGADHLRTAYDLGTVRPGRRSYTAELAPVCATSCRVTGLVLEPVDTTGSSAPARSDGLPEIDATVAAEVRSDGVWRPIPGFAEAARWRDDGQANAQIDGIGRALSLSLQPGQAGGQWPQLLSADVPSHLPAVVASGTASTYPGPAVHDASSFGLDEISTPIDGMVTAVTLPQLDRFGVMVDLGLALKEMTAPAGLSVQFQVWLDPSAPADMRARLAAQHVAVTRTVRAATFRTSLDHSGPAFADGLFLVAAAAAALLAIGATVFGGIVTARRRAYELAALEAAGVPSRSLRLATAGEQGILLGVGLLVGVGAGLGGSVLALPSTPFFVHDKVGPPSVHGLPLTLLGVLVGCVIVAFALTSWTVARIVYRQASAARLREAQQ
jgi:hypothetical protein